MGAILGTIAGWEKDSRWTSGYRIYTGPAYIKYEVPPERISAEKRHEYRVRLDITVYLCDTPDLIYPIVIREIKGILMVSIHEEEYPGGLEQWISDISIKEAEELLTRSNVEVAGLVPCEKGYDVKTHDEQYTGPILPITPPEVKEPEALEKEEKKELEEKLEKKVGVVPVPVVPKYILGQIEYLEERYSEAETTDEKMAIKDEIDKIKQRYGVSI